MVDSTNVLSERSKRRQVIWTQCNKIYILNRLHLLSVLVVVLLILSAFLFAIEWRSQVSDDAWTQHRHTAFWRTYA